MTKAVSPLIDAETSPFAVCTITALDEIATTVPRMRSGAAAAAVVSERPTVAARVSPKSRVMV